MKSRLTPTNKGTIYLLLSAFCYSIMPVMMRYLGGGGVPPMAQVFLRYIFAMLAAGTYFFIITKSRFKPIAKRDLPLLLIATIFGYAFSNLFLTYGILMTEVGNALFLFYTYAILTPIAGFLFLKEKINLYHLVALVMSLGALGLLFQPNSIPTWKIGGMFAILAALSQTAYLIIRKILKHYSAGWMMLVNTVVGVVIMGLMSLIFETVFYTGNAGFGSGANIGSLSPQVWLVTILFGIDNFLAWIFMTKGFELFKAGTASLILLTELVFGVIFAMFLFGEIPTALTIMGGILIVVSSITVILKGDG